MQEGGGVVLDIVDLDAGVVVALPELAPVIPAELDVEVVGRVAADAGDERAVQSPGRARSSRRTRVSASVRQAMGVDWRRRR